MRTPSNWCDRWIDGSIDQSIKSAEHFFSCVSALSSVHLLSSPFLATSLLCFSFVFACFLSSPVQTEFCRFPPPPPPPPPSSSSSSHFFLSLIVSFLSQTNKQNSIFQNPSSSVVAHPLTRSPVFVTEHTRRNRTRTYEASHRYFSIMRYCIKRISVESECDGSECGQKICD